MREEGILALDPAHKEGVSLMSIVTTPGANGAQPTRQLYTVSQKKAYSWEVTEQAKMTKKFKASERFSIFKVLSSDLLILTCCLK